MRKWVFAQGGRAHSTAGRVLSKQVGVRPWQTGCFVEKVGLGENDNRLANVDYVLVWKVSHELPLKELREEEHTLLRLNRGRACCATSGILGRSFMEDKNKERNEERRKQRECRIKLAEELLENESIDWKAFEALQKMDQL